MSLVRLIIWSSLIGGWSAFFSWFVTELAFHAWLDVPDSKLAIGLSIVMATVVAMAIGGGVSVATGLTNPKLANLAKRLGLGLVGGLIGGLFASLLAACVFYQFEKITFLGFVSRVFGWTLTGIAVGITGGVLDRNLKKIRNGLIGGGVGGFLAGIFFVPMSFLLSSMSSRAFAFVLLGLCIGLFVGLAQVILKETWLTVEAGFRPGRQMILGQDLITMGTSEKASLIFIAYGAKGVEPIHLKITKLKDGGYALEDNQSRTGTLLNGHPIRGTATLNDGDAIQFGVNVVRFNERVKRSATEKLPPPVVTQPAPVMPTAAIAIKPPVGAIQLAAPKQVVVQAAPPKPAPKPAVQVAKAAPAAAPAAPPKPQEGRCPICDRVIVGIPGQRRCGKCFTTF